MSDDNQKYSAPDGPPPKYAKPQSPPPATIHHDAGPYNQSNLDPRQQSSANFYGSPAPSSSVSHYGAGPIAGPYPPQHQNSYGPPAPGWNSQGQPPAGGYYGPQGGQQQMYYGQQPPPQGYYGGDGQQGYYGQQQPPYGYGYGYPPQGRYLNRQNGGTTADGICAGLLGALACCCCLDFLF